MTNIAKLVKRLQDLPRFDDDLSLDRLRNLLQDLGNPQLSYPGVIVGGTNGKGSTANFLFSLLVDHGVRVGLYTSPHLMSYRERFQIGDRGDKPVVRLMSWDEMEMYLQRFVPYLQAYESKGEVPTWFEILTAMAFIYFAEQKVDWVVLEVGLGGRLDACNVRDWPYKIITNVALDHQRFLGSDVCSIAREKVGIVHMGGGEGRHLFTAAGVSAVDIIAERCRKASVLFTNVLDSQEKCSLWKGALLGQHQRINACLAVRAFKQIKDDGQLLGFDLVTNESILKALQKVRWPGRLEWVASDILLDGAHNPSGIDSLIEYLNFLPQPPICIFASKKKSFARPMLRRLANFCEFFFLPPINPLIPSVSPLFLHKSLVKQSEVVFDLNSALYRARLKRKPFQSIVVCGSLYLVGQMRRLLIGYKGTHPLDKLRLNQDARRIY